MTAVDIGADGAAPGELDLAAVFAALPGATLVVRADAPRFTVAMASDAYLRATLLEREEALDRPLFDVLPDANPANPAPSGVANLRASLETVLQSRAPHRMPVQRYDIRRPDGGWDVRYWAPLNVPVPGPDGAVRHVLHHVEDVTAVVLGREALARAEHHAARILARIADAYIVLDRDFRFVDVNAAAERSMQRSRAELLGRSHWEVFPASFDIDAGRNYRRAAHEGVELHFTEHYRYEGYDVHLEMSAYPTDEGGVAVFWRDVTDRARAEAERARLMAEVAAERERLRAVILCTPAPLALLVGPEHRLAIVNDAYRRVSGGGRDVTGLTLREAFPELAASGIYELFDRVYETGEPWFGRETLVRYDRGGTGAIDAWFDLRFEPVQDAAGRVTGVFNFAVDVTDQVLARREVERLLNLEQRARAASEAARTEAERAAQITSRITTHLADGVCLMDAEGRLTYMNPAAERILGWTEGELRGEVLHDRVHYKRPDGRPYPISECPLGQVLTAAQPVLGLADQWVRKDGSFLHVVTTCSPIVSDGRVAGAVLSLHDDSERRRTEAERERLLADAEAARAEAEGAGRRLSFLADASAALLGEALEYEATLAEAVRLAVPALADYAAVDMVAEDGSIRRVGAAHRDPAFTEVARQAGRHYAATPDPAHPHAATLARGEARLVEEVTDSWMRAAARSPEHLADMRAVGPRSLMLLPLRARERVAGLLILARTTSGRRYGPADLELAEEFARRVALAADNARLFAEGEAARSRAEAASRAKSDFLAVMSHELRTPLNAIGGYAELIELGIRGPVTAQQREDLARIQRSQRALLGLINEVLNYARLETGAVTYAITDVLVAEAVAAAETLVAPQLRAKGLGYAWAGSDPALAVRADRDKLQQILLNLLSNAVKFTNARAGLPGRIEVSCDVVDRAVLIRVRDTGVGVPADKLEAIFEPFVQVNASLTRTNEGTGLGLAISRDLARGMGGDLTAESVPGAGSTFTLGLPAAS